MRMKKTVCYIDKKGQYRNRKYSLEYCHLIYRDCEYTQCPLWVKSSCSKPYCSNGCFREYSGRWAGNLLPGDGRNLRYSSAFPI